MLHNLAKFGLVGILNTAVDFILFNILTNKKVGLRKARRRKQFSKR